MRKKSRLTITLPKELLSKIDSNIDGSVIRNRSHAIESLIQQSLKNSVETAVILAGKRMSGKNPTLKLINNKPVILHLIENIANTGVQNILICGGADNKTIKSALSGVIKPKINIRYISENSPLGTGGILKKIEDKIVGDTFLVIHGDIITELNLETFVSFHANENTVATIAVKPRKTHDSYGKVLIEGNQITDFFDKSESKGIDIVNTGIYLFNSSVFTYIPKGSSKLETDSFPDLANQGQLTAFIFQGMWYDISDQKEYKLAAEKLRNK